MTTLMKKKAEYILMASIFFTPARWVPPVAHFIVSRANNAADYCNEHEGSNRTLLPEIMLFILVWVIQMAIWFTLPVLLLLKLD